MNAPTAVSSTPAPAARPAASSQAFRRRVTDNEVVLIVDDSPENLGVLGDLLQNAGYRVKVANSGRAALHFADKPPIPSLILLDIMMPDIDGHEVLRQLRSQQSTRDIPVIFLTAKDTGEDEEWAFSAGVSDYIVKPFRPAIILARVRSQLLVRQARHWLVGQNQALEAEVERRMRENQEIQNVSIRALAHLAETRDYETGKHIQRTQEYVRLLATHLVAHPRFTSTLTPSYIDTLVRSAPLHDIGKVGIPDHILLKPGRLTDAEREVMKTHTTLGSNAISAAEQEASTDVAFLVQAKEIARWHHERWDGTGYPDGLSGEGIPISARLMALADVFDALISRRVYKAAFDFSSVRDIIIAEQGKLFDPDVAQVFLDHWEEFEAIALHYGLDR
ncbi:response regulator [Propionivibrio dicarboxylicus]|uniref:Putative two-component system response regulator n=1 Tax=Propionivibrio dicarboxylicus TaxID=83767 RepID=A0A1G8KQZ7_9RHOO|nr:HD domain-containing phosphohydrolase [Propionivibrio dicarboxylicus]SDI45844.1 putative two-component system response regulator [Propionivibrio dicarboxylicus]